MNSNEHPAISVHAMRASPLSIPDYARVLHEATIEKEGLNRIRIDSLPTSIAPLVAWHRGQVTYPNRPKVPNWRVALVQTFERFDRLPYGTGNADCFIFACACVDAMLGTDLEASHQTRKSGVGQFWGRMNGAAQCSFFDCVGVRTSAHNARPGDILQIDEPIAGRVHAHWAVASEWSGFAIGFGTQGIVEDQLHPEAFAAGGVKCWHIGLRQAQGFPL